MQLACEQAPLFIPAIHQVADQLGQLGGALGGTLTLAPAPERGTALTIVLPRQMPG